MTYLSLLVAIFAVQQLSGDAVVIDGDTLALGEDRIRLHGIDAPESSQWCRTRNNIWACGEAATAYLTDLINEQPVRCDVTDIDRYGRSIGICYSQDVTLNEHMVRSGFALAYRQYSVDYIEAERLAASESVGMWAGSFAAPWDWRRGERDTQYSSRNPLGAAGAEFADKDCSDFASWEEAQAFFEAAGLGDPHRLDGNRDGIACNALQRN
ncbi:thermonuclease family protein [Maricaulaceae bacterium EIL42A08]|nr:thermonuclease family protein [Maricaulaceae bacterium EIL42A08]